MNLYRILPTALLAVLLLSSHPVLADTDKTSIATVKDARLDQKLDFSADGQRISEVFARISQSTGVTLAAGLDANDWMVRDRKVILYVKAMPLRDLMREVSSLLHFEWRVMGDGDKRTYGLWQDDASYAEEQSLRTSAEDAKTKQFREKREGVLSDMASVVALSKADSAKLASSDPWRYVLATDALGKDVVAFFKSFPDARKGFVDGSEVSFSVATLSPELQGVVKSIAESYESLSRRIGEQGDHSELLSKFDKLQIIINRHTLKDTAAMTSGSMLGGISISNGQDTLFVPIFDPSSSMAKALGRAIVNLQTGLSKDEVANRLQKDLAEASTAPSAAAKDPASTSTDPAIATQIALFNTDTIAPLPTVLKSLAAKTGMNVISDYFPSKPATITGGVKSLGKQLEVIRSAYGSTCEKTGRILKFRDKEWFSKRAWEIPQVWLDYWAVSAKQNNGLPISDLVQIAKLRDAQLDNAIATNPVLVGAGAGEAVRNREILRFYGSLTFDQQKQAATQRLSVSSLTDDQWKALQKALSTKGAAYAAAEKGNQFIQYTQSGTDMVENHFAYYPADNEPAVEFKVSTGGVYGLADMNTNK
ncbi:MAG: hypothetical protein ABFD54_18000 [Armatimonadota bacterium]|nr:hypothetical protein [bacterium]